MSSSTVAKRYAKALFQVALERKQLDVIEVELHSIHQLLVDHPSFLKLLYHPQIDNKVKKEEFNIIFSGNISETMVTFMNLLIDRNREDALEYISEYYVQLANKERGLEDAQVTSLQALTDVEKQDLATHFGKLVNKKIRIHNIVDPSILGGVIVKIGDRLFDGSVVGKLNRFKRRVETSKS